MKLADALLLYDIEYLKKMCAFFGEDTHTVSKEMIVQKVLVPRITDQEYLFTRFALMSENTQHDYFKTATKSAMRKCNKSLNTIKRVAANVAARICEILNNMFNENRLVITKIQKYDHLNNWMYLGGLYVRIDEDTDVICDEIIGFVKKCISGTDETAYSQEQIDRDRAMIKMRSDYLNRLMEVYGVISFAHAELIFSSLYFEPLFTSPFTLSLVKNLEVSGDGKFLENTDNDTFPVWSVIKDGDYLANFVIDNPDEIIACQKNVDIYIPSECNELFHKDNLNKNISDIVCKQNEAFQLFDKYCIECYNCTQKKARQMRMDIECYFTLSAIPCELDDLNKYIMYEFTETFGEVKAKDTLITILDNIYDNFNNWKYCGYTPRKFRELKT